MLSAAAEAAVWLDPDGTAISVSLVDNKLRTMRTEVVLSLAAMAALLLNPDAAPTARKAESNNNNFIAERRRNNFRWQM